MKLLGGLSLRILPEDRNLYHAAAVMAGNHFAALIDCAVEMLKTARVERSTALTALAPLIKGCTENSLNLGPVEAFNGADRKRAQRHDPNTPQLSAKSPRFFQAIVLLCWTNGGPNGLAPWPAGSEGSRT